MQRDIGHIVARHHAPVCDAEGEAAPVPERRAACRQPVGRGGLGHEAHRLAREQRGGDFLHQGTLAEAPAGGRRVEGETQCRIAGGGDRSACAEGHRDGTGEPIRAVMTAQQGHDAPAVL